ncbi:hypothetical protein PAXRUDRAFT_821915 [Paxillus rubicundulus Ve08.2h10]|uniref:Uncharacterized protein n=1 Tax=Paxillus rubicundulus Ve08.2h10 TaxID=930991 RepID=A0A0D0DXC6_9AGAM|nr:hypothetical protein PAXRUDRAFT_821915 [Paxillus rubicundulus Ve08.2h10]
MLDGCADDHVYCHCKKWNRTDSDAMWDFNETGVHPSSTIVGQESVWNGDCVALEKRDIYGRA